MRIKKTLVVAFLSFLFITCQQNRNENNSHEKIIVGVTTIIEQPALVQAREGFEDKLKVLGYNENNLTIHYENAYGSLQKAQQIAVNFVSENVNIIYAISTPSAQSVQERTDKIPIIFGAVTDPVSAKLVDSWDKPGGNITGVSDFIDPDAQFKFFKTVLPNSNKVGIVYDPGQPSASFTVKSLKKIEKNYKMEIIEAPTYSSGGVRAAALSLEGKVDMLYIVPDNTVGAALDMMSTVSSQTKIPLLSCETGALKKGLAIAALSFDYYKIGQRAGEIANEIIKGKKTALIPVQKISESPKIIISQKNAKKIGVEFSDNAKISSEIYN